MSLPSIKVGGFEGPFDLLLHLIKQNKMDIYDIKIYDITNQYLEYINKMKEMDLEITSEFIVVAATLIEIKSKTLLPKKEKEEEVEENVEEKLLERLLEYRKIKSAANYLRKCTRYNGEIYTKKPEIIDDTSLKTKVNDNFLNNITMLDLFNLFNTLINRYLTRQNTETSIQKRIPIDKYKIEDKMNEILEKVQKEELVIKFSELTMDVECKLETVVIFLALLELIKIKKVKAIQKESFGNIYIERVD